MTVADHAGADDPDSAITKRAAVSSVRMTTKVTSPFQPLAVGDELGRHADLEVARLCVVAESRDIDPGTIHRRLA
jgi:hypothetical protein